MAIKEHDDGAAILIFDPKKSRMPLGLKPTAYDDCEHLRVSLDEQARSVTCQACGKQVDAFWYLLLLAKEWRRRAYRDEEAKRAAKELRQQELNAKAKGHFFTRPAGGAALRAWDTFAEYYGEERFSVYRMGNCWYSEETDGPRLSEDYVLGRLAQGERFTSRKTR